MRDRLLVAWATVWWLLTWPYDTVADWRRRAHAGVRDAVLRHQVENLGDAVVALTARVAELEAGQDSGTAAWTVASTKTLLERVGRLEIDRSALRRDVRDLAKLAKELPAQRIRLHEAQMHGQLTAGSRATTTADGVEIKGDS